MAKSVIPEPDPPGEGGGDTPLTPGDAGQSVLGLTSNLPPDADPQEAGEPIEAESEPQDGDHDHEAALAREAAKWRRRLRDTEGQLAEVSQRLEAMQRSQIDAQVADLGAKPAAVWASGVDLGDLVAGDGTVDAKRVSDVVAEVREQFGLEKRRAKPQGLYSGLSGRGTGDSPPNRWEKAFTPRQEGYE